MCVTKSAAPKISLCADFARQYQHARDVHRPIWPLLSEKSARGMGFVVSHGVRGKLRWSDWLQRDATETRAAA